MRLPALGQPGARARQFLGEAGVHEPAAHVLEAQVDEPGIDHVGFAVMADACELTALVGIPDLRTVEAQLAGKTQQHRGVGQGGPGAILITRQHVHDVDVPPVKAAEVVVVAEGRVFFAGFPVARRGDLVPQGTIVQHRKIESAAIPAHQVGRVLFDAVEEAQHQLAFAGVLVAETPDPESLARAECTGNRHDALLLMRQEIAARLLPCARLHGLAHFLVGQPFESVQPPPEFHVRHGFDVEYQRVHRDFRGRRFALAFALALLALALPVSSTATATIRPASSVSVTCPFPMPSLRRTFSPRGE